MKLLAKINCYSVSIDTSNKEKEYEFYLTRSSNFGIGGKLILSVPDSKTDFELGKEYYLEFSEIEDGIRPLIFDPEHYPEDREY